MRIVSLAVVAFGLTACAQRPYNDALMPRTAASAPSMSSSGADPQGAIAFGGDRKSGVNSEVRESVVQRLGTGVVVGKPNPAPAPAAAAGGRPVSFSFENGDVREIVRNILGDLLNENYIIDPAVTGTITMRTTKPIPDTAALALLESVLRGVGASLVRDGSYWRVQKDVTGLAPPAMATRGGGAAGSSVDVRGTNVVIVPIKQIGAKEMVRLLKSFNKNVEQFVQVDELRNMLFITASQPETQRILELVDMFDVDLLAGMSFLLYRIQNGDTKTIMTDLNAILSGGAAGQQAINPFAGLLRVIPLERMNALLIISPEQKVIQEARQWIERLDEGGAEMGTGQRLYVYNLRYTQAEKIQPVLQSALSGRSGVPNATVAPGQTASTLNAPVNPIPGQSLVLPGNAIGNQQAAQTPQRTAAAQAAANTAQTGSPLARNASIVADKDRNALLIVASAAEYAAIEAVIRRLDVAPKQVAIEVQIAEILLTGSFEFGLQSYFQGMVTDPVNRLTSADGLGQLVAGASGSAFTYTWRKSDTIKAVLNADETRSKLRTIAQPTLITMENLKATFTAGTQISVRTQQTTGNGTTLGTDSFQYINTGINIGFTPRVTGRNIVLEIQQEISDVGKAEAGNPNPPIIRRTASTNVMVPSGDTMLMGGLFQEAARSSTKGLPFVSSIPVVGGLFGSQSWQDNRTELVMLVTPRVLENEEEAREAVDDLRKRLQSIEQFVPSASTKQLPTRAEDRSKLLQELRALDSSLRVTPAAAPGISN